MKSRPSRFVVALARWALMAGLAGLVLSLLALIDLWRAPDNLDARRNLLIIAAVLLSLSFILAPFVRRAFGVLPQARARREERKTLLDEMRGQPDADRDAPILAKAPEEQSGPEPGPLFRVIIALYVAFGVSLAAVLLAMR